MDNFDLKKYLVENKVTINSKMLTEEEGNSWTMITGYVGGAHSEMIDGIEHKPFTGTFQEMRKIAKKLKLETQPTQNSADFIGFEDPDGAFLMFVKDSLITGPIDDDFVYDLYADMGM